jgi:hypothetical protein
MNFTFQRTDIFCSPEIIYGLRITRRSTLKNGVWRKQKAAVGMQDVRFTKRSGPLLKAECKVGTAKPNRRHFALSGLKGKVSSL